MDRLKTSGYKTNKSGFDIGTGFEFYDDLFLIYQQDLIMKKLKQIHQPLLGKKQQGDYWDTFLNLNFDLDTRNQKFKTTAGYRSSYGIDIPLISETSTFTNKYFYKHYMELYDQNITS